MVGTYMIQSGSFVLNATLIEPFLVGLIVGILTAGIVYINEFPDTLADKSKGRMHLVARMGKETASKFFVYLIMSAYILVIIGVLVNILPNLVEFRCVIYTFFCATFVKLLCNFCATFVFEITDSVK